MLAGVASGMSHQAVADELGVHKGTVQNIVRRNGDLAEALADVRSEYLSAGFKYMWAESLDYFRQHAEAGTLSPLDRKNLALTAAISIDKLAMVQGWPTAVVAHLHEHRHQVSDIASKLAAVARGLQDASTMPDDAAS